MSDNSDRDGPPPNGDIRHSQGDESDTDHPRARVELSFAAIPLAAPLNPGGGSQGGRRRRNRPPRRRDISELIRSSHVEELRSSDSPSTPNGPTNIEGHRRSPRLHSRTSQNPPRQPTPGHPRVGTVMFEPLTFLIRHGPPTSQNQFNLPSLNPTPPIPPARFRTINIQNVGGFTTIDGDEGRDIVLNTVPRRQARSAPDVTSARTSSSDSYRGPVTRTRSGVQPRRRYTTVRPPPSRLSMFANSIVEMLFDILVNAAEQATASSNPRASESAIRDLQRVKTIGPDIACHSSKCLICLESFDEAQFGDMTCFCNDEPDTDDSLVMMPCRHVFHKRCLEPWLQESNQCPTCRYEILTENEDYNRIVKEKMKNRDAEIMRETMKDLVSSDGASSSTVRPKRSAQDELLSGESFKRQRLDSEKESEAHSIPGNVADVGHNSEFRTTR